jgi:PAS domain S-box-containing protein
LTAWRRKDYCSIFSASWRVIVVDVLSPGPGLEPVSDERRFQLLVDAVRDYAIFMLDPHGIVSSWNSGAQRFKGYKADEIIGQHFSRFYTDEDRQAGVPQQALATAVAEGKYETEGWRVRKDGRLARSQGRQPLLGQRRH